MDDNKHWPAWYNGPKGEAEIFNSADEVPAGWTTGAEKRPVEGGKPAKAYKPETTPAPANVPQHGEQVDAHGWPWSSDLHASTKTLTGEGLWRMKVGIKRPEPKPGFPLTTPPLDL